MSVNDSHNNTGFELGKKSSFAKASEQSEDKSPVQAKKFLGFAKYFSEFAKLICEVCNHYFINFVKMFFVSYCFFFKSES